MNTSEDDYISIEYGLTTKYEPYYCGECWYEHPDGRAMRREEPSGLWVLRDKGGKELDWGRYRHDIMERHFGKA